MRIFCSLLTAACFLAVLPRASSAHVGLGTNLGLTIQTPPEGGHNTTTVLGWPNSATHLQPGIRIGYSLVPRHEVYLNTGVHYQSQSDSQSDEKTHFIEATVTVNYQYNFRGDAGFTPYATVGGGLVTARTSGELNGADFNGDPITISYSDSYSSPLFGGGLGIAGKVADGSGRLRAEVRYDRVTKGGDVFITKGAMIAIRLGFDLWMK